MKTKAERASYRLAHYQIIEMEDGAILWKSHSGLGTARSGRCFIGGDVLFIAPFEIEEPGFLKREFLEHLSRFPKWDRTKYYCPQYTLHACSTGTICNPAKTSAPAPSLPDRSHHSPGRRLPHGVTFTSQSHRIDLSDLGEMAGKGIQMVAKGLRAVKSLRNRIRNKRLEND